MFEFSIYIIEILEARNKFFRELFYDLHCNILRIRNQFNMKDKRNFQFAKKYALNISFY